jgi:predicted permease
MKPLRRNWRRVLGMLPGRRREHELSAELESHIQMQIEDNKREGMSPDAARRAALLKFGGVESAKESYRDQRGLPFLETALADLRYAARTLRKSPTFTVVAVLTLAVGIGANTAIFSLVDQLLLHPSGVSNPERIVALRTNYGKLNLHFTGSSSANLPDLRAASEVFEKAALGSGGDLNYTGGASPERLVGLTVTAEWFDVFGARPLLGRVFTPEEDQPNMNRVAVPSHGAWTRLFGADATVIGRTVQFNQVPHQIIGVMRPEFRGNQPIDVYTPLGLQPELYAPRNRFNESFLAVARTRPGVSFDQAQAWLGVLTSRVHNSGTPGATYAQNNSWSLSAMPFTDYVAGDSKSSLLLLLGAVGFVLLIACSNIAGLMVARTSVRFREMAVRAALGASRARLMRQALSEALLLAAVGGAAGLVFALGAVRLLLLLAPEDAASGLTASLNLYVLAFCGTAAAASGLLFGLAPAWQIGRFHPQGALKTEGRSNTVDAGKQRLRSLLVIGETALALTLLVAAGLFLRSFIRLQSVSPGFEPHGVMTAYFWLPQTQYAGGRAQATFDRALLEQLRSAPGVTAAGLGTPLPLSGAMSAGSFSIDGRQPGPGEPPPHGDRRWITPGYMEALSIPLKRGRYFTDQDRIDAERVAIVDENLARQYWPGEDPLGKRIRIGGDNAPWYTIVGIVGHVTHTNLANDSGKGVYYFTMFQSPVPMATIVVKASQNPGAMASIIRNSVRAVDPNQAVHSLRTMEDYVSRSLSTRRFGTRLLGFFAVTALFLAALGLYGVISYSVAQRTREIGIRMALGAERGSVMKLVVSQGFRLAAIGVVLGIIGAASMGRLLEGQLFQVSVFDPLTVFGMAAVLLLAGLLASYLPALRAVRVDPVVTLRYE